MASDPTTTAAIAGPGPRLLQQHRQNPKRHPKAKRTILPRQPPTKSQSQCSAEAAAPPTISPDSPRQIARPTSAPSAGSAPSSSFLIHVPVPSGGSFALTTALRQVVFFDNDDSRPARAAGV